MEQPQAFDSLAFTELLGLCMCNLFCQAPRQNVPFYCEQVHREAEQKNKRGLVGIIYEQKEEPIKEEEEGDSELEARIIKQLEEILNEDEGSTSGEITEPMMDEGKEGFFLNVRCGETEGERMGVEMEEELWYWFKVDQRKPRKFTYKKRN